MKRYILFGITLLMAFPTTILAQDDELDEEEVVTPKARPIVVKKQYETRLVRGCVLDAATKQPLAGAIWRAAEIDGYSALSGDDGSYELKVPLFSSSLYVSTPDYTPVMLGLVAGENQNTVMLYSTNFKSE